MGRREGDPRPELELLPLAGAEEQVTEVVRRRGEGGPSRRTLGLLAAVVVAVVVGASLAGGGDDQASEPPPESSTTTDRSTTTRRPTSTTSSTTTVPGGPVLPTSTGGAQLVVALAGGRWTAIDLDTGARRAVVLGPGEGVYGGVGVRDGVVLVDPTTARATYWDLSGAEAVGTTLGPADQAMRGGTPDEVWLLDADGYRPDEDGEVRTTARLVALDGSVRQQVTPPPGLWVSGFTDRGAIAGGGGRVFLVDAGGVRPIATGELLGVAAGRAVVRPCDEDGRCRIELIEPGSDRPLRLAIESSAVSSVGAADGADGAIALLVSGYSGAVDLWVVDPDGGAAAHGTVPGGQWALTALPGGAGWAFTSPGGGLSRLVPSGTELVEAPLAGLDDLRVDGVLVTIP